MKCPVLLNFSRSDTIFRVPVEYRKSIQVGLYAQLLIAAAAAVSKILHLYHQAPFSPVSVLYTHAPRVGANPVIS